MTSPDRTLPDKWAAPFDPGELDLLERFQDNPATHSYTCPDGHGDLQPNRVGLVCWCGYLQTWSHAHGN